MGITRLVEPDPHKRMSVTSALWHSWLVESEQTKSTARMTAQLAASRPPSPAGDDRFTAANTTPDPSMLRGRSPARSLRGLHTVSPLPDQAEEPPTLLRKLQEKQLQSTGFLATKALQSPREGVTSGM